MVRPRVREPNLELPTGNVHLARRVCLIYPNSVVSHVPQTGAWGEALGIVGAQRERRTETTIGAVVGRMAEPGRINHRPSESIIRKSASVRHPER